MSQLVIPKGGLSLHHSDVHNTSSTPSASAQIIRLDLVQSSIKDILRSFRNNEQVRLRAGSKPALQFGKKSVVLHHKPSPYPTDLFSQSGDGEPLYFSGKLSHALEAQKAQEATEKSDHALAALENTLKSLQEQKASNETSFVRNKEEMSQLSRKNKEAHLPTPLQLQASAIRKDRLLNGITRSTPIEPFPHGIVFSRLAPTSAPLLSSAPPSKDKVRFDAMRIPIVHLLAVRPMSVAAIAKTLRASVEDCERVLQKVARDAPSSTGKKDLKDKAYRELDVWKFPYQSQEDRQSAIDHAIQVFDRMRIERTDNLWQLLLPIDERGKGKYLSKLNFDKPAPTYPTTQLIPTTEDTRPSGIEGTERGRKRPHSKGPGAESRALSQEPLRRKKVSEKEIISKQKVRKEAIQQVNDVHRERARTHPSSARSESKYKSAERIEDSDDDADSTNAAPTKPEQRLTGGLSHSDTTKPHSPRPPSSPMPNKTLHKSKLSTSSLASSYINNDQTKIANADSTKLKAKPRTESSTSRISPRPRTDSSPQKPSPLRSSPPTNSTDIENSSSSKASSRSSATSSPPSSTEMPQKKAKNFSPIVSEKRLEQVRGRSPVKRKAELGEEQPPSKRHQASEIRHTKKISTDSTGNGGRPTPDRHQSDSASSTASEKPEQLTEDMIVKSKRFQLYYKRYKDLHEKVSSSPKEDEQEFDELLKMHKRLVELKKEIWDDWRKLGEPGRIEI